jgi:hypothetical protein
MIISDESLHFTSLPVRDPAPSSQCRQGMSADLLQRPSWSDYLRLSGFPRGDYLRLSGFPRGDYLRLSGFPRGDYLRLSGFPRGDYLRLSGFPWGATPGLRCLTIGCFGASDP